MHIKQGKPVWPQPTTAFSPFSLKPSTGGRAQEFARRLKPWTTLPQNLGKAGQKGRIPADAVAHFEERAAARSLPGSAKTNKGNREELDKVLSRIQALRSKTVEQGCTEAEALLAASKVAELLDQYGLTLSEIGMKSQSCASEGVETSRRRRSPLPRRMRWRDRRFLRLPHLVGDNASGDDPERFLRPARRCRGRALSLREDRRGVRDRNGRLQANRAL